MDDTTYNIMEEKLAGFGFGEIQSFRNFLAVLNSLDISNDSLIEYVNEKVSRETFELASNPMAARYIETMPRIRCPKCDSTMTYRVLRQNPLGYRSNFVCDNPDCMYDHYDFRTVPEVLNEGIRVDITPELDEGT